MVVVQLQVLVTVRREGDVPSHPLEDRSDPVVRPSRGHLDGVADHEIEYGRILSVEREKPSREITRAPQLVIGGQKHPGFRRAEEEGRDHGAGSTTTTRHRSPPPRTGRHLRAT